MGFYFLTYSTKTETIFSSASCRASQLATENYTSRLSPLSWLAEKACFWREPGAALCHDTGGPQEGRDPRTYLGWAGCMPWTQQNGPFARAVCPSRDNRPVLRNYRHWGGEGGECSRSPILWAGCMPRTQQKGPFALQGITDQFSEIIGTGLGKEVGVPGALFFAHSFIHSFTSGNDPYWRYTREKKQGSLAPESTPQSLCGATHNGHRWQHDITG